jgi:hypothetical protein
MVRDFFLKSSHRVTWDIVDASGKKVSYSLEEKQMRKEEKGEQLPFPLFEDIVKRQVSFLEEPYYSDRVLWTIL